MQNACLHIMHLSAGHPSQSRLNLIGRRFLSRRRRCRQDRHQIRVRQLRVRQLRVRQLRVRHTRRRCCGPELEPARLLCRPLSGAATTPTFAAVLDLARTIVRVVDVKCDVLCVSGRRRKCSVVDLTRCVYDAWPARPSGRLASIRGRCHVTRPWSDRTGVGRPAGVGTERATGADRQAALVQEAVPTVT